MNRNNLILTLLIVYCLLLNSCDKSVADIDKLPPITQSGKGTFGCLINGKLCTPTSGSPNSVGHPLTVELYNDPNTAVKIIVRYNNGGRWMIIDLDSLSTYKTYQIDDNHNKNVGVLIKSYNSTCNRIGTNNYYTKMTGEIKITKLDLTNKTLSGLFHFNIIANGCGSFDVTDGRFDVILE